jgi:hypothetical protein
MAKREDIAAGSGTRAALYSITQAASEQTTECPAVPQDLCDLAVKFTDEQVTANADQPNGISAALES